MYYGRNKSYSDLASSANNNPLSDEDDDPNDYERDEDSTARFDLHRRRSTNTVPSEHASALQRVKSLTERNRMVSYLCRPLAGFCSRGNSSRLISLDSGQVIVHVAPQLARPS